MILKNILLNTFTQIRSIFITFMNMFKKRETRLYPDVKTYLPPRYRGRIVLTKDLDGEDRCVACGLCAVVCPVGCISLQKSQSLSGRWFPKFFRINFSRCIFCGLCEEACPTTAIQLIPEFELGDYNRQNLVYEKKELSISGPGKSTNYNFYKTCGISLDKNKNFNATPIDIKSLLL